MMENLHRAGPDEKASKSSGSGAGEYLQVHFAAQAEAERLVDADRAGVVSIDVQEWRFASGQDSLGNQAAESSSVAQTAMGGCGANAAHFREPPGLHALAGHGDQFTAALDADEVPELMGTDKERAGFGECGQCQHL